MMKFTLVLLMATMMCSINAMKIDCTDKDTKTCKIDMMKTIEKEFKTKHIEIMKTEMTKMIDTMTKVITDTDMPKTGTHITTIKKTIDDMKVEMDNIDKLDMDDYDKTVTTMKKIIKIMKIDMTKADIDNKDDVTIVKVVMDKYGMKIDMAEGVIMMIMTEIDKIWTDVTTDITDVIKKDTDIIDIDDMMKKMVTETVKTEKIKTMVKILKKMKDIYDTTYMRAIIDTMCDKC